MSDQDPQPVASADDADGLDDDSLDDGLDEDLDSGAKGDESLEVLEEEELADDDVVDGTEFLDAEVGEGDEDNDDDDSEDDDDDADADDELDALLEEDDEVQPLDEEDGPAPKTKPRRKPELISDDEFTCRNCFLVKKPSQLADAEAVFCFDCV